MTAPTLFDDDLGGLPAALQTPRRGGPATTEAPAAAPRATDVPALTVIAHGQPAPQGSKRAFISRSTGRAGMKEDNPATASWRETVSWAVRRAMTVAGQTEPLTGPLRVEVVFTMRKPAGRPKTRVTWPDTKPDTDKLIRAVFDATTSAGGWVDDARVIDVHAVKAFPGEHEFALSAPGLHMRIWQVTA